MKTKIDQHRLNVEKILFRYEVKLQKAIELKENSKKGIISSFFGAAQSYKGLMDAGVIGGKIGVGMKILNAFGLLSNVGNGVANVIALTKVWDIITGLKAELKVLEAHKKEIDEVLESISMKILKKFYKS